MQAGAPALELMKVVVPFLGGLLGAWLGGVFAFRKFKLERALDRRLRWIEDTFRAAVALQVALQDWIGVINSNGSLSQPQVENLFVLTKAYAQLVPEGRLYAGVPAREALRAVWRQFAALPLEIPPDQEFRRVSTETLEFIQKTLSNACNALAKEYRVHAWPKLDRLQLRWQLRKAHPDLRD